MTPYYVIFFILSVFALSDSFNIKKDQRTFFLYCSGILLTLFAGLRRDNADWGNYVQIFIGADSGGMSSQDFGFNVICSIVRIFTHEPVYLFLTVAFFSVSLNLDSFKKYSPYFLTAVLFYFVHLFALKEMIQIRAGLASAICIYNIRNVTVNNKSRFWFLFFMAICIHLTAAIFLLVYIANLIKPSRKVVLYVTASSLFIGLVYPFGQLIKNAVGLTGSDSRLEIYAGWEDYASSLGIFSNITTVKCLVILSVVLLYYNKFLKENEYFRVTFYSYTIGLCWLLVFNDFAIVGARISNLLLSVEPILISYLVLLFQPRSRFLYICIVILVAFIILKLNMEPSKITPYKFYYSYGYGLK